MATHLARPSGKKSVPTAEAKARVLDLIADGCTVIEAMGTVGRTEETYRSWRKSDPAFKSQIDGIRDARAEEKQTGRPAVPDFDVFCRDWLKQPLYPHQLRMWDVIEGRVPRDLHDAMTYLPGYNNRVVINVPPDHAKSTTFTVNYSVWMIHKNPDVRIVIMSQGRELAARFLGEIKFKLTSPLYRDMHLRFAPEGGWRDPDQSWTTNAIYVNGKGGDKDPTVQSLGLGSQIYGTRSDVIFLDDVITTKNVREIEKQMILLDREIESRLPPEQDGGGLLAIMGTRVAPRELYRELIDVIDGDEERVWTYFRQPAVLDYGKGDSDSWVTLWPERYPGKSLARRRRGGNWNLIYQQLNIDDEMTFKAEAVYASINGRRVPGLMTETGVGHRPGGMAGLYVVGGLDPAGVGNTAIVIAGLDRGNEKRYILDGFNKAGCAPQEIHEKVKYYTDVYGVHEWVIERNALQTLLTRDQDLVNFLRSRGTRLTEHNTNRNKYDEDYGVATMAPLFESCGKPDERNPSGKWKPTPETALIELPSPKQNDWVNDLIQQLTIWQPDGMTQGSKTDLVMALWFTHIAFSRILNRNRTRKTHFDSPFMSRQAKSRQKVISLSAMRAEKNAERDRAEGIA